MPFAGNFLVVLVALARYQHDIALMRATDGFENGACAIGLDVRLARHPRQNGIDDVARILVARVVAGDPDLVRAFCRRMPHQRTLAAVAVAAAAEYANQAAAADDYAGTVAYVALGIKYERDTGGARTVDAK